MLRKRTLYDIFKLRVLLYFVVPVVLAAIIIFANHRLNIRQYYKQYNDFYNNYTDEVFFNMDNEINTIVQMDYWLKNHDINKVFNSDTDVSDLEARVAIQKMQKMKDDFNIIDSILIVNRKADYVIATNGKATLERYFNDIYRYKVYDNLYFKGLRYPAETMLKLPPTAVEGNDGSERYVLPIVKMASLDENPNSFFVFNISLEKLLGNRTTSKYTSNTSFWFVNKKDRQFYSGGKNIMTVDEKVWNTIDFDKQVQNYKDNKGNKYCVITRTISPNLMDYAYVVFIPIKDVGEEVSSVTVKIVVVSLIIYLLFAVIVMILASDIGKFFGKLIKPLNFNEQVKMKEIFKVTDRISRGFSNIVMENKSMKLEIKNMVGDVKEKMITDVLNNKNRQVKMSLYKYDSFIPVIFRIIPKNQMDDKVLLSIKEQLYSALHKYFDGMYETYDITKPDEEACFVLNVPHNIEISALKNGIEKLSQIVSGEEINVRFEYLIGEICDSFEKLKGEYLKLRESFTGKTSAEQNNKKYLYRASEHNSIINSILEGDYNKTIANIDRILISNVLGGVSADDMKVLYQNIINTIITALKMKKVDVDNLINSVGNEAYFNIGKLTETEISSFVLELIKGASGCDDKNSEERLIEGVCEYVNENFRDYSLTLESVAKHFNVDAKNLSKQFKKYNAITFHKYLTELKIEEAKRLLITTNMSVEQIYMNVGYISRTTFIRAFNSVEKLTPSEYRKNIK